MCGIVGCFGLNADEKWVKDEISNLRYRGPDSSGLINPHNNLYFGSTRLAMTDPNPRSNLPFTNSTTGSVISFNGEIYNYRQLRNTLDREHYLTDSDTEVLIKYLDCINENTYKVIQGMYAFAYFDKPNKKLILSRDVLGKKPLYYTVRNQTFYWSSSLNSLRNIYNEKKLSHDGLYQYLMLGYILDPATPDDNIFSIKPGNRLIIDLLSEELSFTEVENPRIELSNKERNLAISEALKNAVEDRIGEHEKIAISLSGGMDSTIIAYLANKFSTNVKGFSASWPDSDKRKYDTDSEFGEKIADNIGIDFSKINVINPRNLSYELDNFILAMQEPNSNPSGLSMNSLYRSISKENYRLVLTGDGSDEIFGGYPRYTSLKKIPNILRLSDQSEKKLSNVIMKLHSRYLNKLLVTQTNKFNPSKWLYWHENISAHDILRNFRVISKTEFARNYENVISNIKNIGSENSIKTMMLRDLKIWLNMESNRKLDRISMFHSIEARSPFQDERVIHAAERSMGLTKYRVLDKKLLIKEFPEIMNLGIRRDKAGFISPLGHWLRQNPNLVRKQISFIENTKLIDKDYLRMLEKSPFESNFNNVRNLWSIVVLSRWLEIFEVKV